MPTAKTNKPVAGNGSRFSREPVVGSLTGPQTLQGPSIWAPGGPAGTSILAKGLPASYATYRRIRRDPTVALVRALSIAPVVSADWSVESDDDVPDEAAAFVQDQLMPRRQLLVQSAMEHGIDYGWFGCELVLAGSNAAGPARVVLQRVKPLLVDLTDIEVDDGGEFAGFYQGPWGNRGEVHLPADRSLLCSFRVEGSNWHGRSLLENIREAWIGWRQAMHGFELYNRKMAGISYLIFYPNRNPIVNGKEVDALSGANAIAAAIESGGIMSLPRVDAAQGPGMPPQPENANGWSIEKLEAAPKQGGFVDALAYFDTLKVRGLLMPERAVMEGTAGTKAEAGTHTESALSIREAEHRYIVSAVNQQIVDPLLALNFGEDIRGKVRLVAAPLTDAKTTLFTEIYKLLLANPTSAVEAAQGIDLDAMIDAIGLPKSQEVVGDEAAPADLSVQIKDALRRIAEQTPSIEARIPV